MNIVSPLPIGFTLLSEHYQYIIKDVLGRGTCGIVYLAEMFSTKEKSSRDVALKEWVPEKYCQRMQDMSISFESDSLSVFNYKYNIIFNKERFINEFEVLSKIDQQNVVKVYDFINTNGTYYYSMEYLPGGTLSDRFIFSKQFNEEQAMLIIKQIAAGLEAFHQRGYIHSDLQLKNIAFRNDDCVVLIDGGANKEDVWRFDESQDIWSLANIMLCLLAGKLNPRSENTFDTRLGMCSVYTQSEQLFALAIEKGNMTSNTEKAIRMAFAAEFPQVRDFINALDGHYESSIGIKHGNQYENRVQIDYNQHKAIGFLGTMQGFPEFYISKQPININDLKEGNHSLQKITNWFDTIQKGFVLGLRLPSPSEHVQYIRKHRISSGKYLAFDFTKAKFYEITVEKKGLLCNKQIIIVDEMENVYHNEVCKFYYACDIPPVIADAHRFYLSGKSTKMTFDKIMPASPFGFCKVERSAKWGMVCINDSVALDIECKYDKILDISEISIPGPGPGGPLFLGTIGQRGERVDYYQLMPGGHLRLKTSLTKVQIAELSMLT